MYFKKIRIVVFYTNCNAQTYGLVFTFFFFLWLFILKLISYLNATYVHERMEISILVARFLYPWNKNTTIYDQPAYRQFPRLNIER